MTGNKYTYESVKKSFEDEGYTLISNTYLNTKTNLEYICNKHKDKGTQKIKYAAFIDGSRCPYCSFENGKYCNPVSNEIKQYATERLGLKFVKACTQDQKSEVYFICPKHEDKGIQHSPWASIRLKKNVCGYCNGFVRSTEDFENLIHEKLPYIKIIGQYSGAKKRVRSLCTVHNYEWQRKAYNLLSG